MRIMLFVLLSIMKHFAIVDDYNGVPQGRCLGAMLDMILSLFV